MKHNQRIDGKFAPTAYAQKVDGLKAAYNRKLTRMRSILDTFSCMDNARLINENKELKSRLKERTEKYDNVREENAILKAKLYNFSERDKLSDLF